MNKKLVAVAVAGVLAAPLAAQAQTANVTLYGRINLNAEYVDANHGLPGGGRLSSNSSRLGVRGTESLGRGLTAIWQIESSINADAGGGTLAGRETFVGLQGSWGTVKMGNFLAPYDDMHPIFGNTPTLTSSILSTAGIWANNGGYGKATGAFDARLQNSFRYDSPNISGFTGSAQFSLYDENFSTDPMIFSVAGIYNNGPFQGGIAWEHNDDVRGAGLDDDAYTITGGWNFGMVRVAGMYERVDYDTPVGSTRRDAYGVTFTIPAGPGTAYISWIHAEDGKGGGSRVGGVATGNSTGADHYTISYTYPLSKRTLTYFGYSGLDNDSNASYNFNINPYPGNPIGASYNGFVAGMVHFF